MNTTSVAATAAVKSYTNVKPDEDVNPFNGFGGET